MVEICIGPTALPLQLGIPITSGLQYDSNPVVLSVEDSRLLLLSLFILRFLENLQSVGLDAHFTASSKQKGLLVIKVQLSSLNLLQILSQK